MHSLLAKGRLLYTHDETITELCAGMQEIGDRDTMVQLLRAATYALAPIYKAHKWLVTRGGLFCRANARTSDNALNSAGSAAPPKPISVHPAASL